MGKEENPLVTKTPGPSPGLIQETGPTCTTNCVRHAPPRGVPGCLHLASYQLTMEHDLNCVRLMRSSAPFLARARPTASALEASSRSIRAACGQHAHLIRRGGECSWAGLRTNPIPPPHILRAAIAGLHLRLVHQGHVDVVEADPVLVRGTRW